LENIPTIVSVKDQQLFHKVDQFITEIPTTVDIEKCRPFRCLGISDEVEVEDGTDSSLRWHLGKISSQKGSQFEVQLIYEDKLLLVEPSKLKPIPCIITTP
jgi:hypothetical protein